MKSLLAATLVLASSAAFAQTTVTKSAFGKLPDGSSADLYTLTDQQLTIRITTFGAHVTSVLAPDRNGVKADVVLGYSDLSGYLADTKTYMGSVVGRYGNRIAHGKFSLNGQSFQLTTNDHGNTLHGGTTGFDRLNWTGKQIPNGVELTLISKDGDQGFPGTVTASVKYTLIGDKLRMDYSATTDKPTVINLTNHSYFNLAGHGDILSHVLTIAANRLTAIDAGLIPTGWLPTVANTPFDFTHPTAVGARINTPDNQLKLAGGYDHNWILNAPSLSTPIATVVDPASGRTLKVYTQEPGVQFYSGNFLDGTMKGRDGSAYNKYAGLCLETQHYPDSPNHPDFPSTTLTPGKPYHTSTIFQFTSDKK